MSATLNSPLLSAPAAVPRGLRRFVQEVLVLLSALAQPREVIAQVELMRKLYVQADAVEGTDPARAARLRQQASRIGL
jgi:hypothetical protein